MIYAFSVGGYLLILIGISIAISLRVKTQEDFMVAGRRLTWPILVVGINDVRALELPRHPQLVIDVDRGSSFPFDTIGPVWKFLASESWKIHTGRRSPTLSVVISASGE